MYSACNIQFYYFSTFDMPCCCYEENSGVLLLLNFVFTKLFVHYTLVLSYPFIYSRQLLVSLYMYYLIICMCLIYHIFAIFTTFYKVFETIYDFMMYFCKLFCFIIYVVQLLSNKHLKTNITTIYSDTSFVVDFIFFFGFLRSK